MQEIQVSFTIHLLREKKKEGEESTTLHEEHQIIAIK